MRICLKAIVNIDPGTGTFRKKIYKILKQGVEFRHLFSIYIVKGKIAAEIHGPKVQDARRPDK